MSSLRLKDRAVSVFISDPWEFGTACGTGPFKGRVADATTDQLIIALTSPINYQGKTFTTVIARSRHVGVDTETVATKGMPSNLILLPIAIGTAAHLNPKITPDGISAIGTVEQLAEET